MSRSLVFVLLLTGCKVYPETKDDTAGAVDGACDPRVTVPTGNLPDADEGVPADAHSDTLGAEPGPRWVRYQWPDSDPSTSAAFLWNTDVDTLASIVEIGPADGFPEGARQVQGHSFLFGGGGVGVGNYRVHEARLCGTLSPDTTYSYRVGGDGAWSEVHTFSTPGAPGSFDTVRVAIAGDSRGAYTTWGQIVAKMDSHEPDFIMFSGDLVEFGSNQPEWQAWLDASGDVLARRPFIAAHGNHEFLAQNYFAQFAFPGNEEWFGVQYGNVHIVALNDTVRDLDELSSEQPAFIASELAASSATWKFALHHQAAYSISTAHGSDLDVREAWVPVFEQVGVDAVFAGHNHVYERSVPVLAGAEDAAGITYIVTGGAGAPLYSSVEEEWFNAVSEPTEHYIIGDIGPESATFTVRDLNDAVIDTFTITP